MRNVILGLLSTIGIMLSTNALANEYYGHHESWREHERHEHHQHFNIRYITAPAPVVYYANPIYSAPVYYYPAPIVVQRPVYYYSPQPSSSFGVFFRN